MVQGRALFVTGTDTGVGKTRVACLLLRQLATQIATVAAYKPVCSGAIPSSELSSTPHKFFSHPSASTHVWEDIELLRAALPQPVSIDTICPQRFQAPLAPPIAARLEQRAVDVRLVNQGLTHALLQAEATIVEGAGGWLCPFTETASLADWVEDWQMPVLIVARPGLGTINHTLLTIADIRRRKLRVAGIILNHTQPDHDKHAVRTNRMEIEARSGAPVLGELAYGEDAELHRAGSPVTISWTRLLGSVSRKENFASPE